MKKLLYILNDCMRRFSYERIAGLYRALCPIPASLYIMRTDGHAAFAPEHNRGEYHIFRLPDYSRFDGIFLDINSIYNGSFNSFDEGAVYAVKAAAASGRPVISMANDMESFYYVGIDNYAAMRSVIEHLHQDQGVTDFWFAMGPRDNFEVQKRLQALVDYCQEYKLPFDESRVYCESFTVQCGEHAFEALLSRHTALPRAIICANDRIALGVCQAAGERGFSIPRDFMVTGFDNDDISPYLTPSLTSLDQLAWTMGDTCVDTMRRIWAGEAVPRRIYTPTELVLRESTGHSAINEADQRRLIAEYMNQNSIVSDFSYKLSALQYKLPGCKSIEEICMALAGCLNQKGIELVLDERLFDPNGEALPSAGYPDTMKSVFTWKAGKEPQFTNKRVTDILDLWGEEAGQNYLYVPLHFMERTIGYLSIWDCIELVRIHAVSTLANTLTVALQNFFTQRNLAHMNRVLSGLSMKDDLTGLYNRMGYHKLANALFKRGRVAVLFIDMDRLKHLNDTFGHKKGDEAIRAVANAIKQSIPKGAIPIRYGGDEFLVVAPAQDHQEARTILNAIISAIPQSMTVSTGLVVTETDSGRSLDDYVREADEQMYLEKKAKSITRQ